MALKLIPTLILNLVLLHLTLRRVLAFYLSYSY